MVLYTAFELKSGILFGKGAERGKGGDIVREYAFYEFDEFYKINEF